MTRPRQRRRSRLPSVIAASAVFAAAMGGPSPLRAHFGAPAVVPAALDLDAFGLDAFGLVPARRALGDVSETAWLTSGLELETWKRYRLAPEPTLAVLGRYLRPWENHTPEWRAYREGPYGVLPAPTLSWRLTLSPEPQSLPVLVSRPCPRWLAPRPLTIVRYAGEEEERFAFFDCEGGIAPDVIDRLSILARAPGTPRPELPLPDAPESARAGEWLPGIHLVDPRLVWALGMLGQAFPGKRIVIMSGYRPDAHTSLHRRGRALDLYVAGVDNAALFRECRKLRDVGCGFYPNNVFLHLDVRPFGTRRVGWVDASLPGEASKYVDGWEDVLEPGEGWVGKTL